MYGVLVVRKGDEMGYLAAYSGQINGRADWDWFVPPVFDYLQPDGYFKQHENEITQINHEIERLENLEERKSALLNLAKVSAEADAAIAAFRQRMAEAKKKRDEINLGILEEQETDEPKVWITFKAFVTIPEAKALGKFCRENGIHIEQISD